MAMNSKIVQGKAIVTMTDHAIESRVHVVYRSGPFSVTLNGA